MSAVLQTSLLDAFDQQVAEAASSHLPSDMQGGIAHYRELIDQFNAAMFAGDRLALEGIYDEAEKLAIKLNGGTAFGVIGGEDAPGCVLARETAAEMNTVPLWGQEGDFRIVVGDIPVRIEFDGMLGLSGITPSFAAYAVDHGQPFISSTGFRSFMHCHTWPAPGMSTAEYAHNAIRAYAEKDLKWVLFQVKSALCEEAA